MACPGTQRPGFHAHPTHLLAYLQLPNPTLPTGSPPPHRTPPASTHLVIHNLSVARAEAAHRAQRVAWGRKARGWEGWRQGRGAVNARRGE